MARLFAAPVISIARTFNKGLATVTVTFAGLSFGSVDVTPSVRLRTTSKPPAAPSTPQVPPLYCYTILDMYVDGTPSARAFSPLNFSPVDGVRSIRSRTSTPNTPQGPRFKVKARKLDHPFLWALLFTASAEDITVWISATSVRASWTGYRVHTTLTVSGLVGSAADLLTFDGTIRPAPSGIGELAVQICASCVGLQLPS